MKPFVFTFSKKQNKSTLLTNTRCFQTISSNTFFSKQMFSHNTVSKNIIFQTTMFCNTCIFQTTKSFGFGAVAATKPQSGGEQEKKKSKILVIIYSPPDAEDDTTKADACEKNDAVLCSSLDEVCVCIIERVFVISQGLTQLMSLFFCYFAGPSAGVGTTGKTAEETPCQFNKTPV